MLAAAARNDRRLFDSLNEGVWERDLASGEVWYSPRYKAMLGFEEHELPNLVDAVRQRLHPDDLPVVRAAYAQAEKALGRSGEGLARVRIKSGEYRWFRGRFTVWPDAQGRPAVLVGALCDVHDQVQATETLKAQQAVLEQRVRERTVGLARALQQAEAKSREAESANRTKTSFLAHMSHELRTPLNGVLGMTQLAQSLAEGAEQRRYLELAHQAGQSLLAVLDDVLDFAQAQAGRLQLRDEPFDLATLAADALRGFVPAVRRKGLTIGFDYVGEITQLRGDAGRVRQILGNLLGNAVKYTDAGGIVLIVAVDGGKGGAPCRVRLRVRDTGAGMDAATAARVFEAFEQGDSGFGRLHGGTGLGLSVVKALAQLMGGDARVRSRPGKGSEFRVDLLLAAEPHQPLRARAATARPGAHAWVLMREPAHGRGLCRRFARIGVTALHLPDASAATLRLRAGTGPLPDGIVIAEDAFDPAADLAPLRDRLGPDTPITVLLRPDADIAEVHAAAERWRLAITIAPLVPADLYALTRSGAGAATPAPAEPAAPPRRHEVLVVEDNLLNQIIAREMLAAIGLQPSVVGSGEEALQRCLSAPPDLVLMDIQMPGMDGLETTRRLRALQAAGDVPHFPIIALSAHAMAADRVASLAAGMDEHLTKPVQLERLRGALKHWLATARG
ncbi:MAG TPA: ATP-binding protein [Burkholderiaceae bacterium]|nr:ATP-binding protein [Burkholderiaceae bacterium]